MEKATFSEKAFEFILDYEVLYIYSLIIIGVTGNILSFIKLR